MHVNLAGHLRANAASNCSLLPLRLPEVDLMSYIASMPAHMTIKTKWSWNEICALLCLVSETRNGESGADAFFR